jgi:hypothetical protein
MAIFISLLGDQIKVTGDTYSINRVLGAQGLKFKFNKDKKEWRGASSLKALKQLSEQSGAIMSSEALDEMARFEKAAEKRAAYMASKRGA